MSDPNATGGDAPAAVAAGSAMPPTEPAATISSAPKSKAYIAFRIQKIGAKKRGISWEMSLEQWLDIWIRSGKWEQRGSGQGYVMCRPGDVGPYSPQNVFIALARQNSSDHPSRKKNLPMGVFSHRGTFQARRKIKGKRLYLGKHASAEAAYAAYLAADRATS